MSVNPYWVNTFTKWAEFMTPNLEQYGPIPRPNGDDAWKKWADDVISLPQISSKGAPSPFGFNAWREWAARFVGVLNGDY